MDPATGRTPAEGGPGGPDVPPDARPPDPSRRWARTEGLLFLEILAVASFAFTRPVLDVFGRDPGTFIAAGAGAATIVVFALTVTLLPALGAWAAAALTRLAGPPARRVAQVAVLGGILALYAHTEISRTTGWPRLPAWGVGLALGGAFAALYLRFDATRTFLRYASAGSVVFLVLFLVGSPVSSLLRPSDPTTAHAAGARTPVLWIVFDELPTDSLLDGHGRIDTGLFPHFAALARDATWYRNNTTVSAFTQRAVPAILTGRYPRGDADPTAAGHPHNAFTLLGSGHRVHALEPLTRLCPPDVCGTATAPLARTTRALLDEAWRVWRKRASGAGVDTGPDAFEVDDAVLAGTRDAGFRRFLGGMGGPPGPDGSGSARAPFDFAHLVLPHTPLEYLPDGRRYDQERDGFGLGGWPTPDGARAGRQRHLLQVQLADRYLGEMIRKLRRAGTYDDTLIVVTADHGASYRPREKMRGFAPTNLVDVAFSPLLVKAPRQEQGRIDDRNAETIDILPTVADLLGVKLPWPVDGIPLDGPARRTDTKRVALTVYDRVEANRGPFHTFDGTGPFEELLRSPAAAPSGPAAWRVFRLGPYGSLVGRPVADLTTGAPSALEGRVVSRTEYDPRSDRIPAYVRAHVSAEGALVAIAVNGRIGAWLHSITPFREANVWGITPPQLWRRGANEIRLFEVTGPPDRPVLHPVVG